MTSAAPCNRVSRIGRNTAWRTLLCALALLGATSRAHADAADSESGAGDVEQIKTRFIIDDDDPESAVPSAREAIGAPLEMGYWVMLVSDRAEAATRRGDLAAAVKYYRAIAKAAPDRAGAFAKICETYAAMGDVDTALSSCRAALGLEGAVVDDYASYVRLLLSRATPPSAAEIADADAVIAHLQAELVTPDANASVKLVPERLRCQLGLRIEDKKRLAACSKALAAQAPDDAGTIAYGFALALMEQDFDRAEALVAQARRAGLDAAAVESMQQRLRSEAERRPWLVRVFADARALGLVGGCAAVLLAAFAFVAARRKLGVRAA
jgi:tetratricopeptide (TPR) repeat protein